MNSKKTITLSIAALLVAGSAYAMGPKGGCGFPPPPPAIDHLQEQLDLSDTQVESLKTLFETQRATHRSLRKERRAMRDQMHEKLSEILTASQLEDFKALRPQRGQMRGEYRSNSRGCERKGPRW